MYQTSIHSSQRIGEDLGIGIDTEHRFKLVGRYTADSPNSIEKFVFKLSHSLVENDFLQERHQDDLRISLSSISRFAPTGLLVLSLFVVVSDLGDEDHGHSLLFPLFNGIVVVVVESGIDNRLVFPLSTIGNSKTRVPFSVVGVYDKLLHHGQHDFVGRLVRL